MGSSIALIVTFPNMFLFLLDLHVYTEVYKSECWTLI